MLGLDFLTRLEAKTPPGHKAAWPGTPTSGTLSWGSGDRTPSLRWGPSSTNDPPASLPDLGLGAAAGLFRVSRPAGCFLPAWTPGNLPLYGQTPPGQGDGERAEGPPVRETPRSRFPGSGSAGTERSFRGDGQRRASSSPPTPAPGWRSSAVFESQLRLT